MPIQSPRDFLAGTIPAEVRNDPAHRDNIEFHLNHVEAAGNLTDSERIRWMYDRGMAQDDKAERADVIEGIHNGCRFFSNLAQDTGNTNLASAAQFISSGTQMYSAYAALSAAKSMAGCINPIATAALAAYTIFSTLRRKKSKGDPFAEALMQNLAFISNQINHMHADMFRGFEQSFAYHRATLELISDGFRTVIQGQDALYQHTTNMHNHILNDLRRITWYVQSLGETLIAGQEAISLQPLSDLIRNADDILTGVTTANRNEHIEQTASSLKHWSVYHNGKASNPIYTGIKFFAYTPRQPSELYSIINRVINPYNPYTIQEWQGMLAHIVKNQLNSDAAQSVNVEALFNPELWIEATSRYLGMRRAYPGLVVDPDNRIVNSIIAAADNQIAWELEKRHSVQLYTTVFDMYEKGIQKIQQMLRDLMFQKVQERHCDISLPLDELLKQYVDLMCVNPNCPGESSVAYFVPFTLTQAGMDDASIRSMELNPQVTRRSVNEHYGYAQQIKKGTDTTYPIPIHHHVFALAERLGLIVITAHQQIKYRKPTESAGSGPTGNGPSSYISDDTYTLKATINGSERIIQIDEFISNHQTNEKTFVQKPSIPEIDNSIVQVRDLINAYLNNQKNEIIMKIYSNSHSNIAFKEECLACIDASIRLLSALMADWPVSIRQNTYVSMNDSSKIMKHLENTHFTWQELVDGLQNPQYAATKHHLLHIASGDIIHENSNFNAGYLTLIKDQRNCACEIRENPPAPPVVEPTPMTPTASELVPALIQTILEQSRQIEALKRQSIEQLNHNAAMTEQMTQLQQMFVALMQRQQHDQGSSSTGRLHVIAAPSAQRAQSPTQGSVPAINNQMI